MNPLMLVIITPPELRNDIRNPFANVLWDFEHHHSKNRHGLSDGLDKNLFPTCAQHLLLPPFCLSSDSINQVSETVATIDSHQGRKPQVLIIR